ncbi:homoserine O-acetyltransferase MetX [Texcoconibacillus texcoconensis]|uniref:Homoserine O-acetyltransferase n=1 Tax=Texcoconibacillus texcoconensis TaxID=1095777 RepID=A0A840QN94_9BACI|nr:homoserine O-acetyltransferase [Texcoconibacillus texcoconensis]MBB5172846.1 homoserine O-acetyltransferase [Texcoconibacillus texcoconensis]
MGTETVDGVEVGTVTIGSLKLENGSILKNVQLAYERSGPIDAPIILCCHALTGNQHAMGTEEEPGWWRGVIGPGKYVDTTRYQYICFNVLGGCDGSTGPTTTMPNSEKRYGSQFPFITVRDIVHAQYLALQKWNVIKLHAVIGGSLGGMQVLEWGCLYPDFVNVLCPIAVTPALSDYAIAYNLVARQAIQSDPNFNEGNYDLSANPRKGMEIARMIGMITYRSSNLFNERFHREEKEGWGLSHNDTTYQVESYLKYQGEKFVDRFDANSYLYLLKAMDLHDISRERARPGLYQFQGEIHAFGFEGDLLYPPEEIRQMTEHLTEKGVRATYHGVSSKFGHDGFLVQFDDFGPILQKQLEESREKIV